MTLDVHAPARDNANPRAHAQVIKCVLSCAPFNT
jgi:hypothetical protein